MKRLVFVCSFALTALTAQAVTLNCPERSPAIQIDLVSGSLLTSPGPRGGGFFDPYAQEMTSGPNWLVQDFTYHHPLSDKTFVVSVQTEWETRDSNCRRCMVLREYSYTATVTVGSKTTKYACIERDAAQTH